MTNLELITQNAQTLEDFLEAVQDDALEAEGCSYDLRLPPTIGPEEIAVTWKDWLGMEAEDDMVWGTVAGLLLLGVRAYDNRLD